MNKEIIREAVYSSINEILRSDVKPPETANFLDDLNFESIDFVELVYLIESKINVQLKMDTLISDLGAKNVSIKSFTIASFINYICEKNGINE